MATTRELKKLHDMMRLELGETPFGESRFQWAFSENLKRPARIKGVYDYECVCGTNVSVHKPHCKASVAVPRVRMVKSAPQLHNQWLIVRWIEPPDERKWRKQFGDRPYPRKGRYAPYSYWGPRSNGTPDKYIALDPGISPSGELGRRVTQRFIEAVKQELAKRECDFDAETESILNAQEKRDRDARLEIIGKHLFPFNKIPGKRGHATVTPDATLQAKGDAAPALRE